MTVRYDFSNCFTSSTAFSWFWESRSETAADFFWHSSIISLMDLLPCSMSTHISSRFSSSLRSGARSGSVRKMLRRALRSGFRFCMPSTEDSRTLKPPNLARTCSSAFRFLGCAAACCCCTAASLCVFCSLIAVVIHLQG